MRIKIVPITSVKPDPNQPRKIFSETYIRGLARSLKVEGIINPIECDSNLTIITGECRYKAAELLGWTEVPVNINDTPLPEYERLRRQMAENLHQSSANGGSPMNPIDVARGYKRLIELRTKRDYNPGDLGSPETNAIIEDILKEVGVQKETIYEYLSLLNQTDNIIEDIAKGRARTFYREADRIRGEYKQKVKDAIAEGKIKTRDDISRFVDLIVKLPEKSEIEFLRLTKKISDDANKILNRSIELQVALKGRELSKFNKQDRKMVKGELKQVVEAINEYLK